jgi:hypothetical protein
MSEIACYDIGQSTQVINYRESRRLDSDSGQESDGGGSLHYYYPKTWELKQSVTREHAALANLTQEAIHSPTESALTLWHGNFYQKPFFEFLETMLHKSALERPPAGEVARTLDSRILQAERATREVSSTKLDVWKAVTQGNMLLVAKTSEDKPPEDTTNRL